MRTEALETGRVCRKRRRAAACMAGMLCAAGPVVPLTAQAAKVQVGTDTEVRSIDFTGVQSIPEEDLRSQLQTRDRVAAFRFRSILGKLPLVPSPKRHPFHPRVLQEDVVRLRDRYAAAGFLGTQVRYEVERVGDEDLLDILFVVDEGRPLRVIEVTIAAEDSIGSLPVPPEHRKSWADMEKQARDLAGHRLDAVTFREKREALRTWWCDRGYSQAAVSGQVARDTLRGEARIRFEIAAGPRNRFGLITVRGNQSVSEHVVRRELPFAPGDLYSDSALLQGRRNLQQLPIIRAARVEVMAPAAADTSARGPGAAASEAALPVTVTVTEAKPRLISGQLGYVTDAGVSSEITWSHSNFTGGARVLSVTGLAQTGLLAVTDDPDVRYRGSVSLQQPQVLFRRLSAVVSPFVEYREDSQDRSLEVGSNFTLVYRPRQRFSTSFDYQISTRDIYEYRLEDLAAGNVDLLTFLTQLAEGELDSLGGRVNTSLFTLSATASTLDDPTNPQRGLFVRPTVQVTAPTAWSSASYWRADCTVFGIAPLSRRAAFVGRVSGGQLFPFGQSLPSADEPPTQSLLALRDASFTAGGSSDVRGWDYRMLGPKFPDIRFSQDGDSITTSSDGYVAMGGFSRVAFSLELRMPMPLLGSSFGSHVFLDGGQVWTDDTRFDSGNDRFGQEEFFYATGAGLHLSTPVGAIKLSVGYKLNPSILDLVDSGDLLRALVDETPTDQLEQHNSHRWQAHFAIGSSF